MNCTVTIVVEGEVKPGLVLAHETVRIVDSALGAIAAFPHEYALVRPRLQSVEADPAALGPADRRGRCNAGSVLSEVDKGNGSAPIAIRPACIHRASSRRAMCFITTSADLSIAIRGVLPDDGPLAILA